MIVYFFWHLFLAVVWGFAMGNLSLLNLTTGFLIGYAILWVCRSVLDTARYCRLVVQLLELLVYFLWDLWKSNLRVASDVLTPTHYMRPGIIALPLDVKTELQISLLANLLSLTPGTLSLELSKDRRFLYVHSMYIEDAEHEKQRLKQGLERRILELSK